MLPRQTPSRTLVFLPACRVGVRLPPVSTQPQSRVCRVYLNSLHPRLSPERKCYSQCVVGREAPLPISVARRRRRRARLTLRRSLPTWCKPTWEDDDLFKLSVPELDAVKMRVAVATGCRFKAHATKEFALSVAGTEPVSIEVPELQIGGISRTSEGSKCDKSERELCVTRASGIESRQDQHELVSATQLISSSAYEAAVRVARYSRQTASSPRSQ